MYSPTLTAFHRITEFFELEGTPTAPSGAQSPIQPDLDYDQGWGIHHLSGQPVPVYVSQPLL